MQAAAALLGEWDQVVAAVPEEGRAVLARLERVLADLLAACAGISPISSPERP